MADSKYANLPGIDNDAPDVYETSDLPEAEQQQGQEEDDGNECVETLLVSPNEAFNKFKGKRLDATGIDFSDRVRKGRRTGYDVAQTEYELAGEGGRDQETPMQRYQRLQLEIRQLVDDVSDMKERSQASQEATEKSTPLPLANQMESLQHQLTGLHLDQLLDSDSSTLNPADPHGSLQRRLMTELEAFQPTAAASSGAAAAPGNAVSYQLHYRPEQAKFSKNARVAELEQRLERMESVIGQNPERLSTLTADTNNKSILSAVSILSGKVNLLEPSQLELVETRMFALTQKLNAIHEKKESLENSDKASKISAMHDLVKKWDAVVETLPHVADRLTALKDLHEQALQFSQALSHLDTAQQQLSTHLKSHADMNQQVEKTLSENMKTVKSNVDSVNQRLNDLK